MVTRINGFSGSGMDIDSLVKNLMASKRVPLDKVNQSKQTLQWQRESYRQVNSQLYDFRNNKLSITNFKSSTALNTQTAITKNSDGTLADATSSAVKAEANADANGVPMKVSVTQLAKAASLEASALGSGYKTSMTLAEVKAKNNGVTLDPLNPPPVETFEFTINNKTTMKFSSTETLSSVISKINANSTLGVKASFDDVTGQLSINSKDTGAVAIAPSESGSNTLLDLLSKSTPRTTKAGQDSVFYINESRLTDPSNVVTYNGVKLTLQAVTGTETANNSTNPPTYSLNADNKPLTITTQTDSKKALETVKSFIEEYNKLIDSFNTKINEEKYRDFPPLTDEQRKAMTESDIKAWDEKAKSGLLKNDSILKTMVSDMRSTISSRLGDLSSFGITTGQYYENGKLYINEETFKKAVDANPTRIAEIFQGVGKDADKSIFGKISTSLDAAMDKLVERAGTSKFDGSLTATFKPESLMGRQLKEYNNRITSMTSRLNDAETRYYKQFATMEAAMNKYQSQLSKLTGASG